MLYVQRSNAGTINILAVTIKEKAISSAVLDQRRIKITNSMTMVEKVVTVHNPDVGVLLVDTSTNSRYDTIRLTVLTNPVDETLGGGEVALENGSHTYKIVDVNNAGQEFIVETGKMHVYTGTFSTETKFGTEVTNTEHTTTDTNTVYIKI